MTISIYKWLCGNCSLLVNGRCKIDTLHRNTNDNSCSHIFSNFVDRGFELPRLPDIIIDFKKIEREARKFNDLLNSFARAREVNRME